ncbi:MAG: type II toxin-antitoxin system VapC family toxin [Acidobacteria bacterium]|nr:type II toxin-antitoxin system VapC family toxin [Acidobacteriota bacterium]
MATEAAFWDTSALVPLFVFQDASLAAQREHRNYPAKTLWWGTQVEVRSSLARLIRDGEIDPGGFETAVKKWLAISQRSRELPPSLRVLEIASDLPDKYGVRALDAFQLAAALVWCKEKPQNRPFICADLRLGGAASDAGFDVVTLL